MCVLKFCMSVPKFRMSVPNFGIEITVMQNYIISSSFPNFFLCFLKFFSKCFACLWLNADFSMNFIK